MLTKYQKGRTSQKMDLSLTTGEVNVIYPSNISSKTVERHLLTRNAIPTPSFHIILIQTNVAPVAEPRLNI